MSASVIPGASRWSLARDEKGYRTYRVTHRVKTTDVHDGPRIVSQASGLPVPGSAWAIGNDYDPWVWCRLTLDATPMIDDEPCKEWEVVQEFSNRPGGNSDDETSSCRDEEIEDPLLLPPRISGGWAQKHEQGRKDRNGNLISNIFREKFVGQQNEWEVSKDVLRIEQNVATLNLPLLNRLRDAVNDAPMWDCPARCVKLKSFTWEEKYHGQCYRYFTRTLEFDVDIREVPDPDNPGDTILTSGHDRDLIEEGSKIPRGRWDTDPDSGTFGNYLVDEDIDLDVYTDLSELEEFNLMVYTDLHGSPAKLIYAAENRGLPIGTTVRHAGASSPITTGDEPSVVHVEKYNQGNLFLLGLPASIG